MTIWNYTLENFTGRIMLLLLNSASFDSIWKTFLWV
jgi:hypothetical protein